MRRGTVVVAALLAACARGPVWHTVDDFRRADEDAIAAHEEEIDGPVHARHWIVVQEAGIAAAASLPDDAVRAAQVVSPSVPHRFVFRPSDRGQRLYRMAYVAEGGVVIGRRFLADLGLEATGTSGHPGILRRRGAATGIDLAAAPRVALDIATLDGSAQVQIGAAFDPDFDGGLLLPRSVAASLGLELYEIPGGAEVQVALGRPFAAIRATAIVGVTALQASGPAEVVFETQPLRR